MAFSFSESSGGFTKEEIELLNYAVITTNIVSILGCLSNIISTLYLKFYTNIVGKMVLNLALADLLLNMISIFLSSVPFNTADVCIYVGALERFAYGSSIVWTCCFAYVLRESFEAQNFDLVGQKYKTFILISYAFGLMIGAASVLTGYYHHRNDNDKCGHFFYGVISTIGVLGVPVLLATLYSLRSYYVVIRKLREYGRTSHWELLLYPMILVLCYVPYTMLSLMKGFVHSLRIPFEVFLVVDIFYNSQGVWNALVYGFGRKCCTSMKNSLCNKKKQVQEEHTPMSSEYVYEAYDSDHSNHRYS